MMLLDDDHDDDDDVPTSNKHCYNLFFGKININYSYFEEFPLFGVTLI